MKKFGRLSRRFRCTEWDRAEAGPGDNIHMSGFSFDPTGARTLPAKLTGSRGAVAALGLMGAALTSPSHAQAPPLGTAASFGVLAGTTVTNTGSSVITGNVGVSPGNGSGNPVTGFPPGSVVPPFTIHAADATAAQAQVDLTTAYLNLAGRNATVDLSGQNLGGQTLIAGV